MKKIELSASGIKTFLQCKYKFYLRYFERKPQVITGPFLAMGSAVHAALEYVGELRMSGATTITSEQEEAIINCYLKSAAELGLEDLHYLDTGLNLLKERMSEFDPSEKIVGVEVPFGKRMVGQEVKTKAGTAFVGAIDKVVEVDNETLIIHDYKTSRVALTQDEANTDIQLSLYDLAASIMYPNYKNFKLVLDYLRLGTQVVSYRSPEKRLMFEKYVDSISEIIENSDEKTMKPTLNIYCGWCDYNSYCPKYKQIVEDPARVFKPLESLSEEELVQRWENIKAAKKVIANRENEINMSVMKKIKDQDCPIKGAKKQLKLMQRAMVNYDPQEVGKLIPKEDLIKMIKINKSDVEDYARKNPEAADELMDAVSVSHTRPFIAAAKV